MVTGVFAQTNPPIPAHFKEALRKPLADLCAAVFINGQLEHLTPKNLREFSANLHAFQRLDVNAAELGADIHTLAYPLSDDYYPHASTRDKLAIHYVRLHLNAARSAMPAPKGA